MTRWACRSPDILCLVVQDFIHLRPRSCNIESAFVVLRIFMTVRAEILKTKQNPPKPKLGFSSVCVCVLFLATMAFFLWNLALFSWYYHFGQTNYISRPGLHRPLLRWTEGFLTNNLIKLLCFLLSKKLFNVQCHSSLDSPNQLEVARLFMRCFFSLVTCSVLFTTHELQMVILI